MLALVTHPARVAEAGGVDTAAREAGAGPLARLGLGHLRVERQVEEAIAQQPAVPVQQPGGAAAAAARRPSPPRPRGDRPRGASAGPAPRLHPAQRPCPAGLRAHADRVAPRGLPPEAASRLSSFASPAPASVPLSAQEGQIPTAVTSTRLPPVALGHRRPVS